MPKHIETRRPAPPKPLGIEDVVAAIHQLGAKLEQKPVEKVDMAERIKEAIQGLEFVLPEPGEPARTKWTFDVERDSEGLMTRVIAKAG